MAQKRMFDKSIIENDYFMDLPLGAKALYFLLGMEADDEGFVSPKRVMRIYGGSDDDLKILIMKQFVIQFESGVVVITDRKENNYLDKNRIKETKYLLEKSMLETNNNKYQLTSHVKPMLNECSTSIEEKSIEESRIEENKFDEFWNLYNKKMGSKEKCLKKWNALKQEERELIIKSLPARLATIKDKQFQPYPETYLNNKRRNDEIRTYKAPQTKKREPQAPQKELTPEEQAKAKEMLTKARALLTNQNLGKS